MKAVWIVDDDQSIRWVLEKALTREKIPFKCFSGPNDLLDELEKEEPQVIVSDIRMPKGNGITLLQQIKRDFPKIPVIVMTAYSDMDSAVAAFKGGAFEYISKPFDIEDMMSLIQRAISESISAQTIKTQFAPNTAFSAAVPELIGQAPSMQEVFRAIGRLAQSNATVLITGESGTGKELVARALHRHGARSQGPIIELNLATTPKELIESELFGHERGAFANANVLKRGRFEMADGGTLFLDEIGDLPFELQNSLLQLLEDGKFYRLGGQEQLKANVRIIATSHQDLEQKVTEGSFRKDLFHRLNVIRLRLPALRERTEDIPLLAQFFLAQSAKNLNVKSKTLTVEALDFLIGRSFPGNVRQLQSVCHWLTVMISSQEIHLKDLPRDLSDSIPESIVSGSVESVPTTQANTLASSSTKASGYFQSSTTNTWEQALSLIAIKMLEENKEGVYQELLEKFEKTVIEAALQTTRGRKVDAAERLGIGRNTITRKLQELGID